MNADWIGAAGQWAGALATFLAVLAALRAGRVERRRVRQDREDRDSAQARLVLVSVEHRAGPDPDTLWVTDVPTAGEVVVVIHNYSDHPILLPWVESVVRLGRIGLQWFPEPGQLVRDPPVPAHGERRFRGTLGTSDYQIRRVHEDDAYSATVGFTDAAGLLWRRTDQHLPVRQLSGSDQQPSGLLRKLLCGRPDRSRRS